MTEQIETIKVTPDQNGELFVTLFGTTYRLEICQKTEQTKPAEEAKK